MNPSVKVEEISKPADPLSHVDPRDLPILPKPYDDAEKIPAWKPLSDKAKGEYESSLDDTIALSIRKPASKEEEERLIRQFLDGLEKLFSRENNWTFLQPMTLSMENCAKCQTCAEACHIYEMSGHNEIYRPTYRAEVLRRLYYKYLKPGGALFSKWLHGDIELNWTTIARLAELSYRCNLCRRCAQTCPLGLDNGLITHDLRKLFSQEMGIYAKELHDNGSMLQLRVGSSTGMNPLVVKDNIEFIDEDTSERTGIPIQTPWDVEGADVLLIHNAGEIMAWPENHGAFATIFEAAGIRWTLSSESQEALGYDNINYGLFYDDVMLAKVAVKHAKAAKKLGVKKIVLGECGHAHKALTVIADRVLTGELNIPRESAMALLKEIVFSGKIKFDPSRNDFPVTLHDPCNMVRLMGIVQPQREILQLLCPQFREMTPHGVDNYCCGGGSGFAIMSGHNFEDWRMHVSGRKKMEQILHAFHDELDPSIRKYVCAPCSNCKGQMRDLIKYYDMWNQCGISYGGLVELIVNAMADAQPGYIEWGLF
ncbi:MAG: (Fe-S)-binding protein [Candidatus Omnitrophota bacterium]|jgi:Fe-S oxidoreductase|nr:MAG: (Fe-S)-binding protein [Candidatus Omnitrophota bacterium]